METRLNPDKSGCQGAFQAHAYGEQEAKDDKDHETYKAGWEKKKTKNFLPFLWSERDLSVYQVIYVCL